ncbi:MAG: hypothetical protein HYY17_13615 [Planctomycetes bacterium]|nr:hypothetical protein [Planctomycetota bacterium]
MLALWLALLAQDDPLVFHERASGMRVSLPADSWKLRTRDFKLNWYGTRCEIESSDGAVKGLLYASVAGWNVRALATWREKGLRGTAGTDELTVDRDEWAARDRGEWLRREFRLVFRGTPFRYVDLHFARGRHNVEWVLWVKEDEWEARREEMRRVSRAAKFVGAWTCPGCGDSGMASPNECEDCGAVGVVGHEALRNLAAKYEIQIVADPAKVYPVKCSTGNVITAEKSTDRLVSDYCDRLARELGRYPEALLRRLALERIVLVQNVRMNGNKVGAVTDHERDTMHLEVRDGRENALFFEETIHHELFHVLDVRDDGSSTADAEWEKLNPAGFRYDPKIKASGRFEDDLQGFLNTYSQTAVGEDKAEVYGQSVVRGKALAKRASRDAVIARKIARVRELVERYEPALDEKFWKAVGVE